MIRLFQHYKIKASTSFQRSYRSLSTFAEPKDDPDKDDGGYVTLKSKKGARGRLKKTALYNLHMEIGCEMVPYAGFSLPLYYKHSQGGIIKEHLWCRSPGHASLFDISHMGQFRVFGKDKDIFLEALMVADVRNLKEDHARLSLLTNRGGGILDTIIISRCDNNIYFVVNGITKSTDISHFEKCLEYTGADGDVVIMYSLCKSHSLLSLQGPAAADALQKLIPKNVRLHKLPFMTGIRTSINDVESCRITRCGYTGEDGFELSVPHTCAEDIALSLLEQKFVNVAGLGARNTLRLEAGLPLYGTDIDPNVSPVEAGLDWTIAPRRRQEGGFFGADHILSDPASFSRRRVGIVGMPRPIRDRTAIFDATGSQEIGHITSGSYSPSLQEPIAMGYVAVEHCAVGTPLLLQVRGKMVPASIAAMPFVETSYYRYVPDPNEVEEVEEEKPKPQYNTTTKVRKEDMSRSEEFHDPFDMFEPFEYE